MRGRKLEGKVALVTGGSRGIGAAIATAYGRAGAAVVVNYVSGAAAAQGVVAAIVQGGGHAIAAQADVGDLAQQERLIAEAEAAFGLPTLLVNNAGVESRRPVLDITPEDWDWHMAVNLRGAFFLAQRVARGLIDAGLPGRIINVSSTHETSPMRKLACYSISKAGLAMVTKSLALELAPHGITVNGLIPGAIRTDINRDVLSDPAYEAEVAARIPLGRIAEAEEVAGAALFLAGDAAGYMTGSTIAVDGGLML